MKTIRNLFLIGLAATTLSLARGEENPAVTNDLAQLQGEWTMVSGSADGQPMPDDTRKEMKRVCKGDETTVTRGGEIFLKAKITMDASKTPKTIDYDMTAGFSAGKKQLGIYELDGERFKACFASAGAERPADFTSKAGDGRTVSVWKRAKPSAPVPEQK